MSDGAWHEQRSEQVTDGVFRIPIAIPVAGLSAVNVYVIVDGDGLVLIDAGWAREESLAQFERSLAELDLKPAHIREVLVTHVHRDHYTQALTLRRLFGSRVRIGAGERPALELLAGSGHQPSDAIVRRLGPEGAAELVGEFMAGRKAEDDYQWEFPDDWLAPGTLRLHSRTLEVIETPGHTTGHVVFHDTAARAVFTGDHILPRITPAIGLEQGGSDLPLAAYLNSLRRILARPDARLLPAHGPVTESVHARANELLAHHERRLSEFAAAVAAGAATAYEAAKRLRWTRKQRPLGELGIVDRMLAIGETRVHLDVCVVRGWLRSSEDADGVRRYQTAQGS
jgi:glyoxylase-like metal-dependent hydrolase (beta-lactamase superfamily II)